jgi:hypothetical protein
MVCFLLRICDEFAGSDCVGIFGSLSYLGFDYLAIRFAIELSLPFFMASKRFVIAGAVFYV